MKSIGSLHLIYFSPTGTTRKVLGAIAKGLNSGEVRHYDLTLNAEPPELLIEKGVAIIGVPVYAGRVPEVFLERMARIKAHGVPVVLVALYGNREFEDALVELRDVSSSLGFNAIAAGAFIGEHSLSTSQSPIAPGRPARADLELAEQFGQQVAAKIERAVYGTLEITGNVPYKERVKFGGVAPENDSKRCTLCGKCAEVCPVHVITVSNVVKTNAANCIRCAACVRVCEFEARHFNHPMIEERRALLIKNCSTPKMPQTFL